MATNAWVDLGYVARTHGVRGTLWVHWHDTDSDLKPFPKVLQLQLAPQPAQIYTVASQRRHKGGTLIDLADVTDMDTAQRLKGAVVRVAEDALPKEAPGEIYLYRLMHAVCRSTEGHTLGTLENIYHHGASVVLGIMPMQSDGQQSAEEVLVPLLDNTLKKRHPATDDAPQTLELELLPDYFAP